MIDLTVNCGLQTLQNMFPGEMTKNYGESCFDNKAKLRRLNKIVEASQANTDRAMN